jgi:5-(carboxyamino)imidazole ribonucleotide mutase
VFGVPVRSSQLNGIDSLLSIVQMPKGVAVGTLAIGDAGAANAGLLAAQVIGLQNPEVQQAIKDFRAEQTATILAQEELVLPSL